VRRALPATLGVVVAIGFRVPTWLSQVQLSYDDGVYGASVDLMASGMMPFRDFFSSQGPVFLPMLRGFDLLGLGELTAPRVAMMASGGLIALATFWIVRRTADALTAAAISLVVGSSGLLLLAAGRLHSEGPAIALGLAAVAVAGAHVSSPTWRALAAGMLIALALATKSLHLVPAAVAVFLILWRAGRGRSVLIGGVSAAVTGLVVSIPFGLDDVWDQYVLFHLDKSRAIDITDNVSGIHGLLWKHDLPIMVLVAIALLTLVVAPRRGSTSDSLPTWIVWVWMGLGVGLLVFTQPILGGFERFAAILIPPAALLASRAPVDRTILVVLALIAVPYQWVALSGTEVRHPDAVDLEVTAELVTIPSESYVVIDEPGLTWFSDRLSHPATVDSSFGRIGAGRMTPEILEMAIADERTCAVVSWSGRFRSIGLDEAPAGFEKLWEQEDRFVAIKPDCLSG